MPKKSVLIGRFAYHSPKADVPRGEKGFKDEGLAKEFESFVKEHSFTKDEHPDVNCFFYVDLKWLNLNPIRYQMSGVDFDKLRKQFLS